MINEILKALHCDNVPSLCQPVKLCSTTYDTHNNMGVIFGFQVYNPVTGEKRSLEGFHSEEEAEAAMVRCIEKMTGEHYEREREAAPNYAVVGSAENRWAEPGFDSIDGERDSRHSVCPECLDYLPAGVTFCQCVYPF